jgi:DNA-binding MarR family transcriptional regulator
MATNKAILISEFVLKAIKIKRIIEQSGTFDEKAVTLLQTQALRYISNNPGASVGTLAQELLMSPSAVAQLTNRLADMKYLKRETDANDRRHVALFLTDEGVKRVKMLTDQKLQKHFSLFFDIPEDDLRQMIRIFTNILASRADSKKT